MGQKGTERLLVLIQGSGKKFRKRGMRRQHGGGNGEEKKIAAKLSDRKRLGTGGGLGAGGGSDNRLRTLDRSPILLGKTTLGGRRLNVVPHRKVCLEHYEHQPPRTEEDV